MPRISTVEGFDANGDFVVESDAPTGYELLEVVGVGGMGVVHRARDVGLGRDVAVKLLGDKYAADSPAAARFFEEARITGQLQHPGVPAVHAAGLTPAGRPFLAMKLIKGATLEDRLKSGTPVNALAVFEGICQAVGYAHAHDVIHRDLKPVNVMVGAFGEVQVMDWGLAKVLTSGPEVGSDPNATAVGTVIESARGDSDPLTHAGSVLGTPAYMPPEQAAGAHDLVGKRSDVFGLGAVLCALLTGKPPFEGTKSDAVRLAAARGDTAAALERLGACGADPDVVALCRCCLTADPAGRPADAVAVAAEVAGLRSAADERARRAEVDAAQAEVRAAESAKRRRVVARAAAAVTLVLVLGFAGALAAALEIDAARREAVRAQQETEAKRAEADREKRRAEAALAFVADDILAAAGPAGQDGGLGFDVTLRQALDAAAAKLEGRFRDDPLTEAALRHTLGTSYTHLGRHDDALPHRERTVELRQAHLGEDHPETLEGLAKLATCYWRLGRFQEALQLRERTLKLQQAVHGHEHPVTLKGMSDLAINYSTVNRHAEALALRERTLESQKASLGPDHRDTLASLNNLAESYAIFGRHLEALALREQTVARKKVKLGPEHPDTLLSLGNLAESYATLGRHQEALALRERTLEMHRAKLGPDHEGTLHSAGELARSYSTAGRPADALPLWEDTFRRMLAARSPDRYSVFVAANQLAKCYSVLGRGGEALATADTYLRYAAGHTDTDPKWVARMIVTRLQAAATAGDAAACRDCAELSERLAPRDATGFYNAALLRAVAAGVYAQTNQPAEAEADADRAVIWLTKAVAAGYKDFAHMAKDDDLTSLRPRPDFKKLLASITPETAPPPRATALK